jgi:hypothetical protein
MWVKDSPFASRLATIPSKRNGGLSNVYPFSPLLSKLNVKFGEDCGFIEREREGKPTGFILFCLMLTAVEGSLTEVNK